MSSLCSVQEQWISNETRCSQCLQVKCLGELTLCLIEHKLKWIKSGRSIMDESGVTECFLNYFRVFSGV